MELIPRSLLGVLEARLLEEQVVLLQGARATGKTTMIHTIASGRALEIVDLADDDVLGVAAADPAGYLEGLPDPVIVDEYQRLPNLLGVVKRSVDRRPRPGAFILTGSVTGALLPRGAETLAGRSHEMTLWGFSQGELTGRRERFIDSLFDDPDTLHAVRSQRRRADYAPLICRGGFPEACRRDREAARRRWFIDYASRVVDRDLPELVRFRQPGVLRQVLRASAARTAQTLNVTSLAEDVNAKRDAVGTYLELLERVFLCRRLPAFARNRNARLARHPKLHMTDTGLAAALVNLDTAALRRHPHLGPLLETFVVGEVTKQLGWSDTTAEPYHYRDRDGHEVDVVLEAPDGRVVGIEVKAATAVTTDDFRGLRFLATELGKDFVRGVVLYPGAAAVQVGDDPRMRALPIDALWTIGRK